MMSVGVLGSTQAFAEESFDTLKAGIEEVTVPKSFLYNQAVLARYNKYREKLVDILALTRRVKAYLEDETAPNIMPELQRLSALANAAQREWSALNRQLSDDERQYRSYKMLQLFSGNLILVGHYWEEATRTRTSRPLQTQMNLDIQNWGTYRDKIVDSISQLDTWQATEAIMNKDPDQ